MSSSTNDDWIISRPDLLGGKPCIKGTRISVEFIVELLAGGSTPAQITDAYPQVAIDAIEAALRFAKLDDAPPNSSAR